MYEISRLLCRKKVYSYFCVINKCKKNFPWNVCLGCGCDPKNITGLFCLFYALVFEEFNGDVFMAAAK